MCGFTAAIQHACFLQENTAGQDKKTIEGQTGEQRKALGMEAPTGEDLKERKDLLTPGQVRGCRRRIFCVHVRRWEEQFMMCVKT